MGSIDQGKLQAIAEAQGWLRQAELHYKSWMWEVGDSCMVRAKASLDADCFRRKPIPGLGREVPETVKIRSSNALGYAIINGVDFDGETMELYVEPSPVSSTKRNK